MYRVNDKKVVVTTSEELKDILENDNGYEYVYLDNDITLESGITINENKNRFIIDGTYLGSMHTLTSMDSQASADTIVSSASTKEIQIRNIKIINNNVNGIIHIPTVSGSDAILTVFDNIIFNGTMLLFNVYGSVKINDSIITMADAAGAEAQEVCKATRIIIGGKTNISSSASNYPLFGFKSNAPSPYVIFLCKSEVILSTDTREFMGGTNRLNFTVLHDTSVHLTTGNGFTPLTVEGVNNVLIDERSSFIFIEKSHQRVPMWSIFGSLTMKEGSELQIINSYANTPSDNYNLHFKGNDCKLVLDNPKNLTIYSKNANVIYTNNPLSYSIKCSRINMWQDAADVSMAGDINNLPSYSWYKESGILSIEGTITSSMTTITSYNITASELAKMPDIGNFTFQNRKQLSVGTTFMNIHPINSTKNMISGHTTSFADILIKYNNNSEIVNADDEGLFEYNVPDIITDGTKIEITANVAGSFVYGTRTVTTPFSGELTLLDTNAAISFLLVPIAGTLMFPKANDLQTKIVDSRLSSSNWKLYAYLDAPLTSAGGFVLDKALVFKKFDDDVVILDTNPRVVFTGDDNGGSINFENLNWSKEKGPLLDLTNDALEAGEEYFATIHFDIEE